MAIAKLSDIVSYLGRRLPGPPDRAPPDPDLLARFLATRDEQAFAQLVRRHGPMVFGVCRRVTGNHHLAEDAFQAVFVVLAAKAGSVRPRTALPAWLYGVAYRTALRARTMSDRRRRREALVGSLPEPASETTDPVESSDVAAVLDEEIARLPEYLRVPVVLCELEGRSRREAAGQLGIPEGTLSSRLATARKALASRLRQRGVALSAATLSAALGRAASVNVPADLTASAVAAALTPNLVTAPVAVLSHGVLRIMFAQKLKAVLVMLGLFASVVFAGGLLLSANPPAAHEPLAKPAPVPAAKPLPKGPNRLLFYRTGSLTLIDPDGKNEKKVSREGEKSFPLAARLSPDGKSLAVFQIVEKVIEQVGTDFVLTPKVSPKLFVRGTDEKDPGTDMGVWCRTCAWSPDGAEIAYTEVVAVPGKQPRRKGRHWIENVKTREKTALKLPESHTIIDWSRDGTLFLTTDLDFAAAPGKRRGGRLYLMNRDGTQHKVLTGAPGGFFGRLSPDGKRVLYVRMIPPKDDKAKWKQELVVLDIETGTSRVADTPITGSFLGLCWSPNGKRIAYTWKELHDGKPEDLIGKETESRLIVSDPDGKNRKTIATEKAAWEITTLGQVDWR